MGILSLLLPGTLLVGELPVVLRWACQDRRGPRSVGRSGSGVAGWRRRSTSWHQYFSFDASCIQVCKEPHQSIFTVGMSLKRSRRFSTMKFFPVVCGRPARRLWLQHAVIMLRDGRFDGLRIIFPTKSICHAAIVLLTQGIE